MPVVKNWFRISGGVEAPHLPEKEAFPDLGAASQQTVFQLDGAYKRRKELCGFNGSVYKKLLDCLLQLSLRLR